MKNIIYISLFVLTVSIGTVMSIGMVNANSKLADASAKNVQLDGEIKELRSKLNKFNGVDLTDLLTVCKDTAAENYSKYISENSTSVKDGLITTFTPRSSSVLMTADTERAKAEKTCDDRFAN